MPRTRASGRAALLVLLVPVVALVVLGGVAAAQEEPNDNCPDGFHLDLRSGVSCVQDYETLPDDGGISYTGTSICPLGGVAVYERRETRDGQPAPGTGGQTVFAFLVRCDPVPDGGAPGTTIVGQAGPPTTAVGETDAGGEDAGGADPSGDGSSSPEAGTDLGREERQRRILIGVGSGGTLVSIAVARVLMRRWGITPKQLLQMSLTEGPASAPQPEQTTGPDGEGGYGPQDEPDAAPPPEPPKRPAGMSLLEWFDQGGASGPPDLSGGGFYFDWSSNQWVEFSTDASSGSMTVTGRTDLQVPGPGGVDLHLSKPAQAGATPPAPPGFGLAVDPTTGRPAVQYQLGQPGDPFHLNARRDRRSTTLSGGFTPSDDLTIDFRHGSGGTEASATWKPNSSTKVKLGHRPGRTDLAAEIRF